MKAFWDMRYGQEEYAYGTKPNQYFKRILDTLEPGKILMAAEGEGRNAVYAATQGWEVVAYDWSENALHKARKLAKEKGVEIDYHLASLNELDFQSNSFDAIGLIYVHFPEQVRQMNHRKINGWLKPLGHVIFEAFSKNHLAFSKENPAVGGPKELSQLYDFSIAKDFTSNNILELVEEEIHLSEGRYHQGRAKVIRFHATKQQ